MFWAKFSKKVSIILRLFINVLKIFFGVFHLSMAPNASQWALTAIIRCVLIRPFQKCIITSIYLENSSRYCDISNVNYVILTFLMQKTAKFESFSPIDGANCIRMGSNPDHRMRLGQTFPKMYNNAHLSPKLFKILWYNYHIS